MSTDQLCGNSDGGCKEDKNLVFWRTFQSIPEDMQYIIGYMFQRFTNLPVLRSIIFMTYDLCYVEQ